MFGRCFTAWLRRRRRVRELRRRWWVERHPTKGPRVGAYVRWGRM